MTLTGSSTLPLIETWINGRGPFHLLIDLGSNVCLLRSDVARRAGVEVLVDRPTTDIVRADTMRIGQALFRNAFMAVYDTLDVEGVLGYNILDKHPFQLDLARMSLLMHDTLALTTGDPWVIRFDLIDRMPYLSVRCGDDTLMVNFDTGASEDMTIPAEWQGRFRWTDTTLASDLVHNNQTGLTTVHTRMLADPLLLGGQRLENVKVQLNPEAEDAWLGCGQLSFFSIRFDPKAQLLRLEPIATGP